MSTGTKIIASELGDITVQALTCDYCQIEVVQGNQLDWILTQTYGSIGPGTNIWQQPKHFCSLEHILLYLQGATPSV